MNSCSLDCQEQSFMLGTTFQGIVYKVHNMQTRPKTQETLAYNLFRLMESENMELETLAKKSGVSSRMIRFILKQQRVPSIEITDKLAEAFGLTGWQLIMPNLMGNLSEIKHIDSLLRDWLKADQDGRKFIESAAHREAERQVSNGHPITPLLGHDPEVDS